MVHIYYHQPPASPTTLALQMTPEILPPDNPKRWNGYMTEQPLSLMVHLDWEHG
jgi:hypothetical protein